MSSAILVFPEVLQISGLIDEVPHIREISRHSSLLRVATRPHLLRPEAEYLGLMPDEGQLQPGPLMLAALKTDPPDASTQFVVSLLSLEEGGVREVTACTSQERDEILRIATRLNTKLLTILSGSSLDTFTGSVSMKAGLVLERLGEGRTTSAIEILERQTFQGLLPQGVGENDIRRLIDDSVNLLGECELNRRRLDEGKPPINLLWPWGGGIRYRVPNLALRYGHPFSVYTTNWRMVGLTRLAGQRALPFPGFGGGLGFDFESLARELTSSVGQAIVSFDQFTPLCCNNLFEEARWLLEKIGSHVIAPLAESGPLHLIFPTQAGGLALTFDPRNPQSNMISLGLEAADDKKVVEQGLDGLMRSLLS